MEASAPRPFAVVTGASEGIGYEIARVLAEDGYDLLIAAENADPFDVCAAPETAESIEPERGLATHYEAAYARYRSFYPALKEAASSQ